MGIGKGQIGGVIVAVGVCFLVIYLIAMLALKADLLSSCCIFAMGIAGGLIVLGLLMILFKI